MITRYKWGGKYYVVVKIYLHKTMDLIGTYSESDCELDDDVSISNCNAEIITPTDVEIVNYFDTNPSQEGFVVGTPINPAPAWLEEDELTLECTPINYEFQELLEHQVRSVYLVTYSQADVAN